MNKAILLLFLICSSFFNAAYAQCIDMEGNNASCGHLDDPTDGASPGFWESLFSSKTYNPKFTRDEKKSF